MSTRARLTVRGIFCQLITNRFFRLNQHITTGSRSDTDYSTPIIRPQLLVCVNDCRIPPPLHPIGGEALRDEIVGKSCLPRNSDFLWSKELDKDQPLSDENTANQVSTNQLQLT